MTRRWWLLSFLLIAVAAYGYWIYQKPLPVIQPDHAVVNLRISSPPANLTWPAYGQAAVALAGNSQVASHGQQTLAPTASIAKVISALCILRQKPLQPGQSGPLITLGSSDVDIYNNYVAEQGSVIPVSAGEQITEYQLLQAMMLPSANNAADSLASWAFGSLPSYAAFANNWLKSQGLNNTTVGSDASGFSPTTTSTASDLVKLGELAMRQPVLAQIVGQASAQIPQAGTIHNVDSLLGGNNIVGIKTGNNDQDKGAFLSASTTTINGHTMTVITAIMDAPDLYSVMRDSLSLVRSAQNNFVNTKLASPEEIVGEYHLPWGGEVKAVSPHELDVPAWGGGTANATISLRAIQAGRVNQPVGQISGTTSLLDNTRTVSLRLDQTPPRPPFWWRLLHPQD